MGRGYILFVFCYLSCLQCLTWFTFSSVKPEIIGDWFHMDSTQGTIDLLLNWGSIMYIPMSFLALWVLERPGKGIMYSVKVGALFTCSGLLVRAVPFFCGWRNSKWTTLIFLHIGQILNACTGPFVIGSPTKLARMWFPEQQFGMITSITSEANGWGVVCAFLLGPYLTNIAGLECLIYAEACMGVVVFVLIMLCFPDQPKESIAERQTLTAKVPIINYEEILILKTGGDKLHSVRSVFRDVWLVVSNFSCLILIIVGGLQEGLFVGWQGLLQQILDEGSFFFSQTTIGWIGFVQSVGASIGGTLIGALIDWISPGKYKRPIILCTFFTTLSTAAVVLFLPCWPWQDNPPLTPSTIRLIVMFALQGFFQGMLLPLFCLLAVELTPEVSPGISTNIIMLVFNAGMFTLLILTAAIGSYFISMIVVIILLVCSIVMGSVFLETRRRELAIY